MNLYEALKMQEKETPAEETPETPAEGEEEETPTEGEEEGSSTSEESPSTDKPYEG